MKRTNWENLPAGLRDSIEVYSGVVRTAVTVRAGDNSALAAVLETQRGTIFIKGRKLDEPGANTQAREAVVAPWVQGLSPQLLWRVQTLNWDVNGFEYIAGRHADYMGSSDLSAVADLMCRLGEVDGPEDLSFKRAELRWRDYVDSPKEADHLAGPVLLHTDWNPLNVLLTDDGAKLIDWAWPTLGAAWIDPACWVLRLIAAGHDPETAEGWAENVPAWHTATQRQLDIFACANARLWNEIMAFDTGESGSLRKRQMREAADAWVRYRLHPVVA